MQPASVVRFSAPAAAPDPLGTRLIISDRSPERLEQLRIAPRFVSPGFETALRDRIADLASFRHPSMARTLRVDRADEGRSLALVSEVPRGARLSDVLAVAERERLDLDINAALCLVRQLVPAVAALHKAIPGAAHGALSPDRIVVTAQARLVVAEPVLGPAIEQLRLSRQDLWRDLHVLTQTTVGATRLDVRADIVQIGGIALALVLGRQLRADELPAIPELLATARETTGLGRGELVAAPLRRWLLRALHLDPRGSFQSAADAQEGLEDVLSEEGGYTVAPMALASFLARYHERAGAVTAPPAELTRKPSSQSAAAATRITLPQRPSPSGTLASNATDRANPVGPSDAINDGQPPQLPTLVSSDRPAPTTVTVAAGSSAPPPPEPVRAVHREAHSDPGVPGSTGAPQAPRHIHPSPPDSSRENAGTSAARSDEPRAEQTLGDRARRLFTVERVALIVCAALALGEASYIWISHPRAATTPVAGTLSIDSRPSAATVSIDDHDRGVTPLTLTLPPGDHIVALRAGGSSRVVPITVHAATRHVQYVELPPAATTGAIDVQAEPGAHVSIDGQPRGTAPVTLTDIAPGDHEVAVDVRGLVTRHRVSVEAGLTTSLRPTVAEPAAPVEPTQGSIAFNVPFEMQVLESGKTLGTTASRVTLGAGRHTLEIFSPTLSFRTPIVVDVVPGRETRVPVRLPKGSVAINATPWAEVWIDGERAGETPIGNIDLPIGPHEIVFKHPDFPEQHHAVSVAATGTTRVSVEMKP
jgi:hypothetical protein